MAIKNTTISTGDIDSTHPEAAALLAAMGAPTVATQVRHVYASESWTHPGTGEVRYYLDHDLCIHDLQFTRYNNGNISSAHLDGNRISNAECGRMLAGKSWLTITENGIVTLHSSHETHADTHDRVVEGVVAAFDFPARDEQAAETAA